MGIFDKIQKKLYYFNGGEVICMNNYRKRIVLSLIVAIGLVIMNIRIWTILLGSALPQIVIVLGLSLPLFITVMLVMIMYGKIRNIKKPENTLDRRHNEAGL